MTKVYINAMQTEREEKDGLSRLIKSHREWRSFENLLKDGLQALGHQLVVQTYHPDIPEDTQGAEYKIYAHVTARDEDGDLFYKDMHLPELFTIDTQGWGADHSAMQSKPDFDFVDKKEAEVFCKKLSQRFLTNGHSKHEQPSINQPIDLPEDYIFVPLQRPYDYVNVHHSPITVPDFIRLIGEWANISQQNIVIKAHPGNRADPEVMATLNQVTNNHSYLYVVNANIHELLIRSKGVFTINSGVGFESLIHGKAVVTFGNCDYKWVTKCANQESWREAFSYIHDFSTPDLIRQYCFIYYYYHYHAYSLEQSQLERSKKRLTKYLSQVIQQKVNS